MAYVKKNIVTQGLSGKLGDNLVFRQRGGKTIVSVKPTITQERTEAQKQHAQRFRQAAQYAKKAIQDPQMKALYQSRAKEGQSAYNVALGDYLNAPAIGGIDLSQYTGKKGSRLRAVVTDDLMVSEVHVAVYNEEGNLLEEGLAFPENDASDWVYTVKKGAEKPGNSRLVIRARDLAGNATEQEKIFD